MSLYSLCLEMCWMLLLLLICVPFSSSIHDNRYDLDYNANDYLDPHSVEASIHEIGTAIRTVSITRTSAALYTTNSSETYAEALQHPSPTSLRIVEKPTIHIPGPEITAIVASNPETGPTAVSAFPTATLPDPATFSADKNTLWTITDVGTISSSSINGLGWDKGRTSVLDGVSFWNFGDTLCLDGYSPCGFSMGAAFFADTTNNVEVDMRGITDVSAYDFAKPWSGDPPPSSSGYTDWGMDTSNVAEVSSGTGVAFAWEIFRNSSGAYEDRGAGMLQVTIGDTVPNATRTGPLIAGPEALQIGLMTVLNAEGYVYVYCNRVVTTGIVVGRALLADAFDATKYEFLKADGTTWVTGIPLANDTSYGYENIHSDNQGSIMFSNYFNKYLLFTGAYGNFMNFYASDAPYGPWSDEYSLQTVPGYGVNVHPEMSPGGSHKELYISSGLNNIITMFKIVFDF